MADSGINESLKWGSTVYDSDDCLQSGSLNDAVQEILVQCGGINQALTGPRDITATISMALAKTDVAKVNDFEPGTSKALELHPAGDVVGNIEISSTDAQVTSRNLTWAVNGAVTMDVTFRLNDATFTTASS